MVARWPSCESHTLVKNLKRQRACLEELSSTKLFEIDHWTVGTKKDSLLKSCLDVTFSSFSVLVFSIMKVGVSLLKIFLHWIYSSMAFLIHHFSVGKWKFTDALCPATSLLLNFPLDKIYLALFCIVVLLPYQCTTDQIA